MRRIDTVTISAPLAVMASSITCWLGYWAVPMRSREAKLRPAMTKGSARAFVISATLARPHDLDLVRLGEHEIGPVPARDDGSVDRDGDVAGRGIDPALRQQRAEPARRAGLDLAVD